MLKSSELPSLARSFGAALAASALALLLVASAGRADTASVTWTSPTPADQAKFNVNPGKSVTFSLTASTEEPGGVVHIAPAATLPKGVQFNSSDGVAARATFKWTPDTPGDYTITFTAALVGTTDAAPTLTYRHSRQGHVLQLPVHDDAHQRRRSRAGRRF